MLHRYIYAKHFNLYFILPSSAFFALAIIRKLSGDVQRFEFSLSSFIADISVALLHVAINKLLRFDLKLIYRLMQAISYKATKFNQFYVAHHWL